MGFIRAWLRGNAFLDHRKPFERLFAGGPIQSVVEFGLGDGTQFFLERADRVKSVEVVSPRLGAAAKDWFLKCQEKYRTYANWESSFIICDDLLKTADIRALEQKIDPATVDGAYLSSLTKIVDDALGGQSFDLGFVDYGLHLRGDLVNALFGRVPVIVAHDTNTTPEIYGWNKIKVPADYVRVHYQKGQGTTFWIRKDRADLIKAMQSL